MTASKPGPRILLAQHGARHRYSLARALYEAGLLEVFCTDSSAHSFAGRVARASSRLYPASPRIGALARREVEGVPSGKIWSSDAVLVSDLVSRRTSSAFRAYQRRHRVLSRRILRRGFGRANWLYVMYDEGLGLLRAARAQGLRTAVDAFIHPRTHQMLIQEHSASPDFATESITPGVADEMEQYVAESLRLADIITCPSDWVACGVCDLVPEAPAKVRIVPYGSSFEASESTKLVKGRVLYAGSDHLRKGLRYLGEATEILRQQGRHYDFRVAGPASQKLRAHALCKNLNFLGKLPGSVMRDEFDHADVFVLPTLSEGFPSVIVEAMSRGIPVITTPCSGACITDGVDGRIVPPRDAAALACAISDLVEDRDARGRLAASGAKYARTHYTRQSWADRLNRLFLSEHNA